MREVNEEQYLKVCKKADLLYLHRLTLLAMSGLKEGDTLHSFYHRIIFDLVEQIYKQEAVDGSAYSAFSENDPIYGALAEK